MEFEFQDPNLERVYYEAAATIGLGPAVDKGFRKTLGYIVAATDELSLRNYKGLHYHKLDGKRSHQHGLNVTDQYRLVVERIEEKGRTKLLIVSVEDYH